MSKSSVVLLTLMGDALFCMQHKTSKCFHVFSNDLCFSDVESKIRFSPPPLLCMQNVHISFPRGKNRIMFGAAKMFPAAICYNVFNSYLFQRCFVQSITLEHKSLLKG